MCPLSEGSTYFFPLLNMQSYLKTLIHDAAEFGKQLLYDAGLGPAPWSHLDMLDTIEFDDSDIMVLLYKKPVRCCEPIEFLIDVRHRNLGYHTYALLESVDLDELLKVLRETKQTIDRLDEDDLV